MDLLIELAVGIVVVLDMCSCVLALFKFLLKTAAALILNAIGGVVILLIANYFFNMLIPYRCVERSSSASPAECRALLASSY